MSSVSLCCGGRCNTVHGCHKCHVLDTVLVPMTVNRPSLLF